jgi:hypothetical protein
MDNGQEANNCVLLFAAPKPQIECRKVRQKSSLIFWLIWLISRYLICCIQCAGCASAVVQYNILFVYTTGSQKVPGMEVLLTATHN